MLSLIKESKEEEFDEILIDLFQNSQKFSIDILETIFNKFENEISFLDSIKIEREEDSLKIFDFLLDQETTNLNNLSEYQKIDFFSILERNLNDDECLII